MACGTPRIALRADDGGSAGGRQILNPLDRLECCGQQHRLLAMGVAQIVRGKPESCQGQCNGVRHARLPFPVKRAGEIIRIAPRSDAGADRNDGDVACWPRCAMRGCRDRRPVPGLDDQMGVVAAEAEAADGGTAAFCRQGSLPDKMRNGAPFNARMVGWALGVAGNTPCSRQPTTLIRAAAPATVTVWPRLAFSDPITTPSHPAKIAAVLAISVASPNWVPVAWHSIRPTSVARGRSTHRPGAWRFPARAPMARGSRPIGRHWTGRCRG